MTRRRQITLVCVCGLAVAAISNAVAAQTLERTRQPATLDAVLAAYRGGDYEVVARTFHWSRGFQDFNVADARRFDAWLGSWQRGKAVMLLEMVSQATLIAPQYIRPLLLAGLRYMGPRGAAAEPGRDEAVFTQLWHRTALALLQRAAFADAAEEYLGALRAQSGVPGPVAPVDPRLVLAWAIAQEQRCWHGRSSLDRAGDAVNDLARMAGVAVRDPAAPSRSALANAAEGRRACLRGAVLRFEAAASADETHAEARVRRAWTRFQLGEFPEALADLEHAEPGTDRDLAYWIWLIRGRVLEALGRDDDAARAYRSALEGRPGAQSASVGLALALVRLNENLEADAVARSVRDRSAAAADPWWSYAWADQRFVTHWIGQLRAAIR